MTTRTVLVCVLLARIAVSTAVHADDVTPAPVDGGALRSIAANLREAARHFRAAGDAKRMITDEMWKSRVLAEAQRACEVPDALTPWVDNSPSAAQSAWYQCYRGRYVGMACWAKVELTTLGCGKYVCYGAIADNLELSAGNMELVASCLNAPAEGQRKKAAEDAKKASAEEQKKLDEERRKAEEQKKLEDQQRTQAESDRHRAQQEQQRAKQQQAGTEAERRRIADEQRKEAERKELLRRQEIAAEHQRAQEARAKAAQEFNDANFAASTQAVVSGPSGGNEASGRSWHFHLGAGGAAPWVPVFSNKVRTACSSSLATFCAEEPPMTSVEGAGGPGIGLDLSYSPVFSTHFGIGFYGRFSAGAMAFAFAGTSTTAYGLMAAGGMRGFVGPDATAALIFDAGLGVAHANRNETVDFYEAYTNSSTTDEAIGSGSAKAMRIGGGLHLCTAKQQSDSRFCKVAIDLTAHRTFVGDETANIFRVEAVARGIAMVGIELSPSYPAVGTASYATDTERGFYLAVHAGKSLDAFGTPKPAASRALLAASGPVTVHAADGAPREIGCSTQARDLGAASEHVVTCPGHCWRAAQGGIWGSDVYTTDSLVCRAAIHAGVTGSEGGVVAVVLEPGRASYEGSTRNGISTAPYGRYKRSFRLRRVSVEGQATKDSDADGVVDTVDRCVNLPEDKDAFEDNDGCADPDNDKDGIADVSDKCPDQPEDLDGRDDDDGCADTDDSKVADTVAARAPAFAGFDAAARTMSSFSCAPGGLARNYQAPQASVTTCAVHQHSTTGADKYETIIHLDKVDPAKIHVVQAPNDCGNNDLTYLVTVTGAAGTCLNKYSNSGEHPGAYCYLSIGRDAQAATTIATALRTAVDTCQGRIASPAANQAPDQDGDGVEDSADVCPQSKGNHTDGCFYAEPAIEVAFPPSSTALDPATRKNLASQVTKALAAMPDSFVLIEASAMTHTAGAASVAQARAAAVKKLLVRGGVPADRVYVDSGLYRDLATKDVAYVTITTRSP